MSNERKMFIQDDDCHWYLIPISLLSLFCQMEGNGEADYYASFNNKFEEYRCDHPTSYTFENVRSIYEC